MIGMGYKNCRCWREEVGCGWGDVGCHKGRFTLHYEFKRLRFDGQINRGGSFRPNLEG